MNIPVDGICLKAIGVEVDEAAMTGESDHFAKMPMDICLEKQAEHEEDGKFNKSPHDVPSPVMLSGTMVQSGEGWFVVIVVGEMTCEGQIMSSVEAKPNETTPL